MKKTKQIASKSSEKYYVDIVSTSDREVIRERDPESEWSGEDVLYHHEIHGYNLVQEGNTWDFVLNERPSGTWYLVAAFYSTGDSFNSEDNCMMLVSFLKHKEDADAIVSAINTNYKEYNGSYGKPDFKPIIVKLPKSKKSETIATSTWKGFFERLNSVEVFPIRYHREQ